MVDAGQLIIQQRDEHLHFTCGGLTAVIDQGLSCNLRMTLHHGSVPSHQHPVNPVEVAL
jgi:hypothetical protein